MKKFLSQIVSAILGLWLSSMFVPGVFVRAYPESNFFGFPMTAVWQIFLLLGIILGTLNYLAKPFLQTMRLPFETVSIGFMSILTGGIFLWLLDMIFDELYAPWLYPLLFTTLIIWTLNLILQKFLIKNNY